MNDTFLGIDFSGGAAPWKARRRQPTVWIATAIETPNGLSLTGLVPVQDLPGTEDCFSRLVSLLAAGDYAAAAIDAPFSIPLAHMPDGGHPALVHMVGDLANASDRPFPKGAALLDIACAVRPTSEAKPLRASERFWKERSVNTRSTLWNGPRGGAPFAVSCLSLIHRSGRPCWPWVRQGPGLLVEAFPAAQLRAWGLPHQGYSGPLGRDVRTELVEHLERRIAIQPGHRDALVDCPDALDSLIAVFSAVAAIRSEEALPAAAEHEGWISVHA